LQNDRFFRDFLGRKRGFSSITFFRFIMLLRYVYIFEIYATRRIFLYPTWSILKKKNFSRLFRPQSADRKSVLLGPKVYFWPLIFISYQLTVVNKEAGDSESSDRHPVQIRRLSLPNWRVSKTAPAPHRCLFNYSFFSELCHILINYKDKCRVLLYSDSPYLRSPLIHGSVALKWKQNNR
jgi:hypothetical protein